MAFVWYPPRQERTQTIAIHALYSLWRIIAGVFLAIITGVPIAVMMGYYKKCDKILAPIVYLTYPIPKIALLPILMLLAGIGELPKVIMIFLIVSYVYGSKYRLKLLDRYVLHDQHVEYNLLE